MLQGDDRISKLEAQVAQLEQQNKELKEWKEKYSPVVTKATSKLNKKHNPLMADIEPLLNSRRDYVKSLISDGKISVSDTDKDDSTVLMWSSYLGHYDIAQLCVNLGANIDQKDRFGRTAIDWARFGAWHHCEQLLLFNKLNANVSDNVQNIAYNINKQNGIIENILNEMKNVINDENDQNEYMNTLTKILCNIIGKKLSFSDDLLNLCCMYNNNSNTNNNIRDRLMETCKDIIENGNKKDWYYFQTFILNSNVCITYFVTCCVIIR